MSLRNAIEDIYAVNASLEAMIEECRRARQEELEDEAERQRKGRGAPDYTAPATNIFGIAIFAEGFGIVGRRWNDRAGENREWGGGTTIQ